MFAVGCTGSNNQTNDSQTANTSSQEQVSSPTLAQTETPISDNQHADNPSQDSAKLANNADQLITISAAIVTYTHDDLNKYSDTIITGTVKEKLPSKWNTIDGKQPNKAVTELSYHDLIYTDTVISVDKYLKNPLSSKEVIVRSIGGTLGNLVMTSDDEPSLEPGEKVLIYLSKDTNPDIKNIGSEHFIVTGFFQGKEL